MGLSPSRDVSSLGQTTRVGKEWCRPPATALPRNRRELTFKLDNCSSLQLIAARVWLTASRGALRYAADHAKTLHRLRSVYADERGVCRRKCSSCSRAYCRGWSTSACGCRWRALARPQVQRPPTPRLT